MGGGGAGKGRGLFTTTAVRKGEHLLVERALAVAVEEQGQVTLAIGDQSIDKGSQDRVLQVTGERDTGRRKAWVINL
jgi:hypothetical protein